MAAPIVAHVGHKRPDQRLPQAATEDAAAAPARLGSSDAGSAAALFFGWLAAILAGYIGLATLVKYCYLRRFAWH